jgi:hypothetical protein
MSLKVEMSFVASATADVPTTAVTVAIAKKEPIKLERK